MPARSPLATPTALAGMSVSDYIRRFELDGPFELVDGEPVPMSPTNFQHARIASRLTTALMNHANTHALGEVVMELPFTTSAEDAPNWVMGARVPDVLFISAARLTEWQAATPDFATRPLGIAPDLAVEIISPTDRYAAIDQQVAFYLEQGVRLVWVINPRRQVVIEHLAGSPTQLTLLRSDTLDGRQVLPGFSLPVAALFP